MKYSIIMPVYNAENSLEKSIESVVGQSYSNWELIIVNDGSTDSSLKILKEYEKKDKRIKILSQKNGGPGKARNNGISVCTGDYIVFIDSDDYIENDYLSLINDRLLKDDYDLLFISMVNEKSNGKIINNINCSKFKSFTKNELICMEIMGIVPWGPCSKVVKRKIIQKSKFSDLPVGEEIIYSFDIINESSNIGFIDKTLYHYVHNVNGQHKKGGYDPWYMVVNNMKNHLININKFKCFESSINGLALRALSISIYRYSLDSKYCDAKKMIKKQIAKYQKNFDLNNVEKKYLNFSTKVILYLINFKFYYILFLSSKLKNKMN